MTGIFEEKNDRFNKLVEDLLGVKITPGRETYTRAKVSTLLKKYNLDDLDALARMYEQSKGTMYHELVEAITNHETSFFREPMIFEAMVQQMMPEWLEKAGQEMMQGMPPRKLEIWSSPCSYGQEAYSIAMAIHEHMPQLYERVNITASDVSQECLEKARSGLYSEFELGRGLPEAYKVKYFTKQPDGNYKISPSVARNIRFTEANMLDPVKKGAYDIVFCRNLSIYFGEEKRNRLFQNLFDSVKQDGFIILGIAETLIKFQHDVIFRNYKDIRYYQVKPSMVVLFKR